MVLISCGFQKLVFGWFCFKGVLSLSFCAAVIAISCRIAFITSEIWHCTSQHKPPEPMFQSIGIGSSHLSIFNHSVPVCFRKKNQSLSPKLFLQLSQLMLLYSELKCST